MMKKIILLLVLLTIIVAVAPAKISAYTVPMLGANFTHIRPSPMDGCNLENTGIVFTYDKPGVRQTVQDNLKQMHDTGVSSLRLLLWFETDIGGNTWGIVPSVGGKMSDPYRTNLIQYLTDVKAAGYTTFTLSFGAGGSNDPMENYGNPDAAKYDPTKFDENWQFIQDVRAIVKQYGPAIVRFDLQNEGAPYDWLTDRVRQQVIDYHTKMYTNYVNAFGANDVTLGFMGGVPGALTDLISIIKATGKPFPMWFHLSLYGSTETDALNKLNDVETTLKQNNLQQPLVVGETFYNDPGTANAIKRYMQSTTRPVWEILEWPLNVDNKTCPNTPYSVSNFLTVFPQPTPIPKPGDLNSDNNVDINDYNLLMANFGKIGTGIVGDINGDGQVNIFDYNLFVGNYGK